MVDFVPTQHPMATPKMRIGSEIRLTQAVDTIVDLLGARPLVLQLPIGYEVTVPASSPPQPCTRPTATSFMMLICVV
jgi:hypothetical protein